MVISIQLPRNNTKFSDVRDGSWSIGLAPAASSVMLKSALIQFACEHKLSLLNVLCTLTLYG